MVVHTSPGLMFIIFHLMFIVIVLITEIIVHILWSPGSLTDKFQSSQMSNQILMHVLDVRWSTATLRPWVRCCHFWSSLDLEFVVVVMWWSPLPSSLDLEFVDVVMWWSPLYTVEYTHFPSCLAVMQLQYSTCTDHSIIWMLVKMKYSNNPWLVATVHYQSLDSVLCCELCFL